MANMNGFVVIVLLMASNLLLCAKIDRATVTRAAAAVVAISPTVSTTPNEFVNSSTGKNQKPTLTLTLSVCQD